MEKILNFSGLNRFKTDLLFILAGGVQADKNFDYDRQRNFYIKEIFGNMNSATEIVEHGKEHKRASDYMFPNKPEQIKSRKFLIELFAECVLINQMELAENYQAFSDENKIREMCLSKIDYFDSDAENVFNREMDRLLDTYAKDFSASDYEEFKALMKRFREEFLAVFNAVEDCVLKRQSNSAKKSFTKSLDKLKIDFLFMLAGGARVDKSFDYDKQRDFYIKEIFGNMDSAPDILEYERNKRSAKNMFPNKPEQIWTRKFVVEVFADCALMNQIYLAENYHSAVDREKILNQARNFGKELKEDDEKLFYEEMNKRVRNYTQNLSEEDYKNFKTVFEKCESAFKKLFDGLKNFFGVQSDGGGSNKQNAFEIVCKKFKIAPEDSQLFKLKLDAFAEIQISRNNFVEYFDSFTPEWEERFPQYICDEETKNYVRQEKSACIMAFGNKIHTIKNESLLVDLLASINLKLALSDGATNIQDLEKMLEKKAAQFSNDALKKAFAESAKKMLHYYALDTDKNYDSRIKDELIVYRADLMYVNEILMEEVSSRDKKNAPKNPDVNSNEKKYEMLLAQKDGEIYELKRELEYYENIQSQGFRNDFSKFDEAMTKLFKQMCEVKYGAPLSELYLLSKKEVGVNAEDIQAIVKNFLFVFSSLGINIYETKNLGKTIKFDSDDANVVYAVDEKNLVDGINSGKLKYPGWKYGKNEIVLPFVTIEKESEVDG